MTLQEKESIVKKRRWIPVIQSQNGKWWGHRSHRERFMMLQAADGISIPLDLANLILRLLTVDRLSGRKTAWEIAITLKTAEAPPHPVQKFFPFGLGIRK